jgi:hypothetical protein
MHRHKAYLKQLKAETKIISPKHESLTLFVLLKQQCLNILYLEICRRLQFMNLFLAPLQDSQEAERGTREKSILLEVFTENCQFLITKRFQKRLQVTYCVQPFSFAFHQNFKVLGASVVIIDYSV